MEEKKVISISVQKLLEYMPQSGDLSSGNYSSSRATEGTKGHTTVRKALLSTLPDEAIYETEVPISYQLEGKRIILEVTGRMDGVLKDPSGITVHEIKTTTLPLEQIEHDYNPQHLAQAKCYGFMFAYLYSLDYIAVRLTYYQLDEKQEKSFVDIYSIDTLEEFFMPLVNECLSWQDGITDWNHYRDQSIEKLEFPYDGYRLGQRRFVERVYRSIKANDILFAQAPTGTGKTIATLYPAVKALGNGLTSKIFYLTAKTTTRSLAEKALEDMRAKGLKLKSLTITAKEKICLCETADCDPESCEYAINYYGKVKKAVAEALNEDVLDRFTIEKYAHLHSVCPFELSLDLSLWCDVIICDYNYLFDPRVYLKRFFTQRGDYCFLIDEAHNLVDRARDMFSATITKRAFFELKQKVKAEIPELYNDTNRLYQYFLNAAKSLAQENDEGKVFYRVKRVQPADLHQLLASFTGFLDNLLPRNPAISFREELLETYYHCLSFMKILELYDDKYVTCYDKSTADFKIKLFCVDPSKLLKNAMDKGKSTVLFSATLSPIEYFTGMLGGDRDSSVLALSSPFPAENLCVYVDDTISTKYKTRPFSYDKIAEVILDTASSRVGNYMAFFPSFDYLNEVYYRFMGMKEGIRTLYQIPGMSEAARQEFLDEFESIGESSLVGFAVMGGVFGEGIDLTGDKLSGAIIVGVGLPQICNERNIIRRHFDEQSCSGFEYAYTYPGLNRVLQAAGRVIRTENDMGVVILLDERFSYPIYRELFPPEWSPILRASEGCLLPEVLDDFWS